MKKPLSFLVDEALYVSEIMAAMPSCEKFGIRKLDEELGQGSTLIIVNVVLKEHVLSSIKVITLKQKTSCTVSQYMSQHFN